MIGDSGGVFAAIIPASSFDHIAQVKFENNKDLKYNYGQLMSNQELSNTLSWFRPGVLEENLAMKVMNLRSKEKYNKLIRCEVASIAFLADDFTLIFKDGELRIINLKISLFYKEFDEYLENNN